MSATPRRAANPAPSSPDATPPPAADAGASSPDTAGDEARIRELEERLSVNQGLMVEMERRLADKERALNELATIAASSTWRIAWRVHGIVNRIAPLGTKRRRTLHRVAAAVDLGPRTVIARRRARNRPAVEAAPRLDSEYREWLEVHMPSAERLHEMTRASDSWSDRPVFSVVMPTYNPDLSWFKEAVASVVGQAYTAWELCIADDGSPRSEVRDFVAALPQGDSRIKTVLRDTNGGIVDASQSALALATGDFIVFMDHDDVLQPHALFALAAYIRNHPDTDVVYSDEDKILLDGRRGEPYFKPDWSPDMLLSWNYMGHVTAMRHSIVAEIGGFREGFDGSQDHDIDLRAVERARHVGHVADVLYSWRQVPGSIALSGVAKPYAYEAGLRAVREAVARRGRKATVKHGRQLGYYDVRYAVDDTPLVDIVIPTRDRVDLLRTAIESIERLSTYRNYRITIVDNDSRMPETLTYLDECGHHIVRHPGSFNYSDIVNHGARETDGEQILFLNNDTEVLTPDWIEAMLELAQRPNAGAVGVRLLYPDGRVQHEGVGIGIGYLAGPLDVGRPAVRNVSAVTGACMMTPRAAFNAVNGYDASLGVAYNDIDYCLRLRQAGFDIYYTPFAELAHHESASRGRLDPAIDHRAFRERWGEPETLVDPFVSPHLSAVNPISIRLRRDADGNPVPGVVYDIPLATGSPHV